MSERPYDHRGRFVPLSCPDINCTPGKLVYEGNGYWRCDGLVDPNDPTKELEACARSHMDGEPVEPLMNNHEVKR